MRIERHRPIRHLIVAAGLVALALAASACGSDTGETGSATTTTVAPASSTTTQVREKVTHDFVIPAGTASRIAKGEEVDVIPKRLEVNVGDRIRVRNDDNQLARLGLFDVSPGETVSMNFNTAGELEGIIFSDESGGCGAPPADVEKFVIDVRP